MNSDEIDLQTLNACFLPRIFSLHNLLNDFETCKVEKSPLKRQNSGVSETSQRLAHYAFKLAEKLNRKTGNNLGFIDACKRKLNSIPIERERNDLKNDDGTAIRSCVYTLIKVSQEWESMLEEAEDVVHKCMFLTFDLVENYQNNKSKYLLLLEILTCTKLLQKYNLGKVFTRECESKSRHWLNMFGLSSSGRRGLFNEDVAFMKMEVAHVDEDLDEFNTRVKTKIEALDEIIRTTHQLCYSNIISSKKELVDLINLFERAVDELFKVGWKDIETNEFCVLSSRAKRLKRMLTSVYTSLSDAETINAELQKTKDELELHLYFGADSFIVYVLALETVTGIITDSFLNPAPKLQKMQIICTNMYKLYYTGCILEDCDPSDRFSTIVTLGECNKLVGGTLKQHEFSFVDDFDVGLDEANVCTNVFFLTKSITRYIIGMPEKFPETQGKLKCPFKKIISKIFE